MTPPSLTSRLCSTAFFDLLGNSQITGDEDKRYADLAGMLGDGRRACPIEANSFMIARKSTSAEALDIGSFFLTIFSSIDIVLKVIAYLLVSW